MLYVISDFFSHFFSCICYTPLSISSRFADAIANGKSIHTLPNRKQLFRTIKESKSIGIILLAMMGFSLSSLFLRN
jgi:hypothetical protein